MDPSTSIIEELASVVNRRDFLRLGTTAALASATGCLDGQRAIFDQPTAASRGPQTSLQVKNRACKDTSNEGTLTTADEKTVVATGTVLGDSTCDDLVLGLFSNKEDTEFIVQLTVTSGADGDCTECETGLEYEATVTFPDHIPRTVHLVYDTRHGTEALDALEHN